MDTLTCVQRGCVKKATVNIVLSNGKWSLIRGIMWCRWHGSREARYLNRRDGRT